MKRYIFCILVIVVTILIAQPQSQWMSSTIFKLKLNLKSEAQTLSVGSRRFAMAGQETSSSSQNVFSKPLEFFSKSPLITGFKRNGFCEVPPSDFGNHSVAAEVTDEFLDFTGRQGNDLRMGGIKAGCKWCLCASRWMEAYEARKSDDDPVVPRVFLNATNKKALDFIPFEELKKFEKK